MKKDKLNTAPAHSTAPPEGSKNIRYSDSDLKEFKEIITAKLQETKFNFELLKETLSGINDHGTDDTSPTFKLLEDSSEITSKEETALHAIRLQKFMEQLQNALIRIENKSYGICSITGKLIPKERLKSVPHTTKSVDAKINVPVN